MSLQLILQSVLELSHLKPGAQVQAVELKVSVFERRNNWPRMRVMSSSIRRRCCKSKSWDRISCRWSWADPSSHVRLVVCHCVIITLVGPQLPTVALVKHVKRMNFSTQQAFNILRVNNGCLVDFLCSWDKCWISSAWRFPIWVTELPKMVLLRAWHVIDVWCGDRPLMEQLQWGGI